MTPKQDDQFDDLDDFDALDEGDDDLPSPSGSGDVASAGEDDWTDYDDEALAGDEAPAAAPARTSKKKSGFFNILLIGSAVLFGGAFIMLKLGGAPAPAPAPQMAPADMSMAMPQEQEVSVPAEQAQAPDAAFPADSTPVAPMAEPEEISNPTLPPMPATIERAEDASDSQAPVAEPAPSVTALESRPEVVPEQNMIDSPPGAGAIRMPQAGDVLLKAPAPRAEIAAATPAPPSVPSMNPEIAAKLDQVIARMDAIENEIGDLRQAQAQVAEKTAVAPPGLDADIASIKQSVATLEAKVQTLSAAAAARTAVEKPPAPTEKPSIIPPKVLGDSADTVSEPLAPLVSPPRPAAEPAVRWVLKGAQPGRAMVARSGEDDIQNVAVGDTLPGIGRITAITYQDGKWVVEGVKGSIFQE